MIDIWLPKEVPSQNTRDKMHWRARGREVDDWELLARSACRPSQLVPATVKMAVRIHAFRRRRCADEANLIGGCKGLIDGLVRVGLIKDDSREWASFTYAEDVASKSPTRKPCVRVTIEPLTTADHTHATQIRKRPSALEKKP